MSYLVFARKWRPQIFEDVVGQEHVTATLKNAILSDRVAHAYLFSGPRGVGKTTTARILAKALNCQSSDKPVAVPCNKCESCIEITEGRSLDVIEIDGASNRGIDEIRQLRENVKFAPSKGRYKVYIIDEVHQITQDGFNALLKTLEEPPSYVKFVFATTHRHKVIPTILSRCQRFDFKRLPTAELVDKLRSIAKSEKLQIGEEALFMIARAADGSVRDAESILDQAVSFSAEKINTADVIAMLGTVEQEMFFQMTRLVIEKDTAAALNLINKFINDGKDPYQFVSGWLEHLRNIAIAKVQANPSGLIDLPKDIIDKISQQAGLIEIPEAIYLFNALSNAQEAMRRSGFARIYLEMAIVKLIRRDWQKELPAPVARPVFAKASAGTPVAARMNVVSENPKTISQNTTDNAIVDFGRAEINYVSQPAQETIVLTATQDIPVVVTLDDVRGAWGSVLAGIKSEKISAALFLMEGTPSAVDGLSITVDFPSRYVFYKEALERNENRCIIEKYLKLNLSADLRLKFAIVDSPQAAVAVETVPEALPEEPRPKPEPAQQKDNKQQAQTEPIIDSAVKIFRARVIRKE